MTAGNRGGMLQIAVLPNLSKRRAKEIVERIFKFYHNRNVRLILPANEARCFHKESYGLPCIERVHVDMVLSIGGDGTLLGACRRFGRHSVPVCGINLGTLGFMADIEPNELEGRLEKILSGDYRVEERLLLSAYVRNEREERFLGNAVNDVVLTKNGVARMLRLELSVNETHLLHCQADGMIASTPTGSTAYSLSAGGPIVNPNVRAFLVTPICAHTFQMRPIVLDENDVVRLKASDAQRDIIVTLDGQESYQLLPKDEIVIRKAESMARIVKFTDKSFYHILQTKLWGT